MTSRARPRRALGDDPSRRRGIPLGAELAGAVVAIGNAPTALFHFLERIHDGAPRPSAVIGMPVGFVGRPIRSRPWPPIRGAVRDRPQPPGLGDAASAVNALAQEAEI